MYAARRLLEAEQLYQRVLRQNPRNAEANNGMGVLAVEAGKLDFAMGFFESALQEQPRDFRYLNNLGNALVNLGRPEEGLPYLQQALKQRPAAVELLTNIGRTYHRMGLASVAVGYLEKALSLRSSSDDVRLALAEALVSLGDYERAEVYFQSLLAVKSYRDSALYGLATSRKQTEQNNILQDIEKALGDSTLPAKARLALEYAAAKTCMDLKRNEEAWDHLAAAKSIPGPTFDLPKFGRSIDALIRLFSPTFIASRREYGSKSQRPVFVVGMPRSGTSLTEQILSSHQDVAGAGELTFMHTVADKLFYSLGTLELFTDQVRAIAPAKAELLAQEYLDKISFFSADALRVTDKMPHNFMLVGLIALLFPNAHILFCRRDPLDNCFSIYSNWFNDSHSYARDLSVLGSYYKEHLRLMEHWKAVLPNQILEVQYETLVRDLEGTARRMVDFIGLPWDPACLSFHENERAVTTISKWQVRQPIYSTSIARWRAFESHLQPLKDALAG